MIQLTFIIYMIFVSTINSARTACPEPQTPSTYSTADSLSPDLTDQIQKPEAADYDELFNRHNLKGAQDLDKIDYPFIVRNLKHHDLANSFFPLARIRQIHPSPIEGLDSLDNLIYSTKEKPVLTPIAEAHFMGNFIIVRSVPTEIRELHRLDERSYFQASENFYSYGAFSKIDGRGYRYDEVSNTLSNPRKAFCPFASHYLRLIEELSLEKAEKSLISPETYEKILVTPSGAVFTQFIEAKGIDIEFEHYSKTQLLFLYYSINNSSFEPLSPETYNKCLRLFRPEIQAAIKALYLHPRH